MAMRERSPFFCQPPRNSRTSRPMRPRDHLLRVVGDGFLERHPRLGQAGHVDGEYERFHGQGLPEVRRCIHLDNERGTKYASRRPDLSPADQRGRGRRGRGVANPTQFRHGPAGCPAGMPRLLTASRCCERRGGDPDRRLGRPRTAFEIAGTTSRCHHRLIVVNMRLHLPASTWRQAWAARLARRDADTRFTFPFRRPHGAPVLHPDVATGIPRGASPNSPARPRYLTVPPRTCRRDRAMRAPRLPLRAPLPRRPSRTIKPSAACR